VKGAVISLGTSADFMKDFSAGYISLRFVLCSFLLLPSCSVLTPEQRNQSRIIFRDGICSCLIYFEGKKYECLPPLAFLYPVIDSVRFSILDSLSGTQRVVLEGPFLRLSRES